jgi:aldose 1-epimerase
MAELGPSVAGETRGGSEFQILREPATGSEAWIVPGVGANCVRFVTTVASQPIEVIREPADWEAFRERPTYHGAAVLFPFPGRIRGARFTYAGVEHQLPVTEPSTGNAIHGCVARRGWTTLQTGASPAGGAWSTFQIGTDHQHDLAREYPFPFRLTMTIRLRNGQLDFAFVAENLGFQPMPFGLGLHPYFPLPFGGAESVDECEIGIEAPYYWAQEAYMPSGVPRRSEESVDLRAPRSLRALASVGIGGPDKMVNLAHSQFSHEAAPEPGPFGVRWILRSPRTNRQVVVEADAAFPASVVYVPPTREKVSFEPHTCLPNAFNLANEGRLAGAITLGPREFWRGNVTISASQVDHTSE